MSKKILKYSLRTCGLQFIEMPQDAQILCIQTQHQIPCLWVIGDLDATLEKRSFEIFATGNELIPENGNREHIGTYQLYNGDLVYHCFEFLGILP